MWTKIVWGVLPNDDGDHFDPKSRSSFKWDTSFDIAPDCESEWMKTFATTQSTTWRATGKTIAG